MGNNPDKSTNATKVQLFATTIIGNQILIVNAPVMSNEDFEKSAFLVNDFMESMKVIKP